MDKALSDVDITASTIKSSCSATLLAPQACFIIRSSKNK